MKSLADNGPCSLAGEDSHLWNVYQKIWNINVDRGNAEDKE